MALEDVARKPAGAVGEAGSDLSGASCACESMVKMAS